MASYWDEVLTDTPTVLLKMDDASGNIVDTQVGNNGTPSGTALGYRVAGPDATGIPYALDFSASSLVTLSHYTDIDLGAANASFSIEYWLKMDATTQNVSVLKKHSGSDDGTGYEVWYHDISDKFRIQNHAVNDTISTADTDLGWHHWAWVKASGVAGIVYRDKVVVTDTASNATFASNTGNLLIGSSTFTGSIAGLALYKSALSSGRVAAHYDARSTGSSQSLNRTTADSLVFYDSAFRTGPGTNIDPYGRMGFFGL